MLQALYSRSAESVNVHLDKVKASGSGKFMSTYYVGYGHKSIADCGSTTIFIEGVSLLAAKAIQDWPLYSGQETSTRYIDMAAQPIYDPDCTPESKRILDKWMDFYTRNQGRMFDTIRRRHPIREGETWGTYERAVKARVFDVLRGFLPAGITTQLSWHTNLRQAGDHLAMLVHHPLDEVRILAANIREMLVARYPSSGAGLSLASSVDNRDVQARSEREAWERMVADTFTYSAWGPPKKLCDVVSNFGFGETLAGMIFEQRPRGCVLPHCMTDLGQASFDFALDFGSFRDLQRHRNGVVRMPLLTTKYGFEPWYHDQLDDDLHAEALTLIEQQTRAIADLRVTAEERQLYTALGFRVPCEVTFALPALVYFLELRTQKTVHPTLRARALRIAEQFSAKYPKIALHVDKDPDDWTTRRGEQTIKERA
jgi:thymidylate synthase ThyX